MKVTLYSKPGCHLCEEARDLLDRLQPDYGFDVQEIAITSDEELFSRYRYEIPVVLADGVELARGRLTEQQLSLLLRMQGQ